MNDETLRPCPFCGDLQGCWHLDMALQNGGPDNWNHRPLEDALRAELEAAKKRAEAAEAEVAALRRKFTEDGWAEAEGDAFAQGFFEAAPEWQERAEKAEARVRELEAHFPRTRDGVAVTPGMVVYCPAGHKTYRHPTLPWGVYCEDVSCTAPLSLSDCTANPPAVCKHFWVCKQGEDHFSHCSKCNEPYSPMLHSRPPGDAEVKCSHPGRHHHQLNGIEQYWTCTSCGYVKAAEVRDGE